MVKPFRNLHRLPKTIDDFSDLVVSKQKGRYVCLLYTSPSPRDS